MSEFEPLADDRPAPEPNPVLAALEPGRHYGLARDGSCWCMVGRDLRDVETWEIVPPAASLTLAWGTGGCSVAFPHTALDVGQGEWMWIDAGLGHRGRNVPGSDFATLFCAEPLVEAACLFLAPIGAGVLRAPDDLRRLFEGVVTSLLSGGGDANGLHRPALNTLLDWVGTNFAPAPLKGAGGTEWARDREEGEVDVEQVARILRADPRNDRPLADFAWEVGLTPSQLSRRFAARFHLSPRRYRQQLRLALATRVMIRTRSVGDAATEGGFADTAHLSRTFRAQYGVPPSTWLRELNVT